ncbi:MAG: hypothetical protein LBQ60_17430 [Bacteroidales bacterium]|jgi:endonuclease/exonuclease/phosphatase family metal-dependent hydrolase|nr:hypothetical protein [Bacteroidales bacterium]
MKGQKIILSFLFLYSSFTFGYSQKIHEQGNTFLRLMFYNVENFFDTENDPSTNDNPFTPEGQMRWTQSRYLAKRNALFRVIANVGEWDPPALIALCEVENRFVLDELTKRTPLMKYPYRIIHKDSPDQRGIDVAILYRNDYLKCIRQQFIRVRFPDNRKRTRDIVYATMLAGNSDTLHIFANHWPSRSGGQRQSEPARMLAASLLREKVDSIYARNPWANIIITGDMNDNPSDKSVLKELKALQDTSQNKMANLFNLTAYKTGEKTGTIKYQGRWFVYDQMIVSGSLLSTKNSIQTNAGHCHIFRADHLFEPDERYSGVKPYRTYIGQKYNNGISDHLPVYLDIFLKKNKRN